MTHCSFFATGNVYLAFEYPRHIALTLRILQTCERAFEVTRGEFVHTLVYWNVSCRPVNVASTDNGAVSISQNPAASHCLQQGCGCLRDGFRSGLRSLHRADKRTRIDDAHRHPMHASGRNQNTASDRARISADTCEHRTCAHREVHG